MSEVAIVGDAPDQSEASPFSSANNRILWPILRRLASIERDECAVLNLVGRPLGDDEELVQEEFDAHKVCLVSNLQSIQPKRVLAVGALATRALLEMQGHHYHSMTVHNGMTYPSQTGGWSVTPCWAPAAALSGDAGKDPLAWMGDALAHFGEGKERVPQELAVPEWMRIDDDRVAIPNHCTPNFIALDTEGTVDDPQCMTFATDTGRYFVEVRYVPGVMEVFRRFGVILVYHHAPWDWSVLEAMGVKEPWTMPFRDTMELAYLKQAEPQGLKDLTRRHFGIEMKSWEDVVMPHYNELVLAAGAGMVDAKTEITTHTKTGKLRKKPIVKVADDVKHLKRALGNPELMAKRLPDFPAPSLRLVPEAEMIEYATLDPFVTLALWRKWQ